MKIITKNHEEKITSQNGEDGIIKHIFDIIGTTNKIAVEFGVSLNKNIIESNTNNLLLDDWKAFWFDLNKIDHIPPNCKFTEIKLTKDNIEDTFLENKIPYEFDFLSIDIDSNDYHMRDALKNFSPRVYVIEYNGSYGPLIEYVMPYNENYSWSNSFKDTVFGASLKSLEQQGDNLGYDLVYCDQSGINAFFIRKDINVFKKLKSEDAWVPLFWAKKIKY